MTYFDKGTVRYNHKYTHIYTAPKTKQAKKKVS